MSFYRGLPTFKRLATLEYGMIISYSRCPKADEVNVKTYSWLPKNHPPVNLLNS
jgi:hypothetical protein